MTPSAPPDARQWISDLADGRLDGADLEQACARWTEDAAFRQTWLTYQLIGDAMRSDDLARPPARADAFLLGLRERLAQEPVVLAPTPTPAPPAPAGRRLRWPVALAASVVAVVGAMLVWQQPSPAEAPVLAVRDPAAPEVNAQMLRDARIDDYLRAHRETLAGSPAALPGGAMRSVDFSVPQR